MNESSRNTNTGDGPSGEQIKKQGADTKEDGVDLDLDALENQNKKDSGFQFDLQEQDTEESPRAPLFVAGRSPRYVKDSPRKGDTGSLIYEAASSSSPSKLSPRVNLNAAPVPIIGSPGKALTMSPLRFGQSPMSMSPPGLGASGGSMPSLEELMKSAESAVNYKLAHEIATDSQFKLSPRTLDPNSLEGKIKAMMEKAFWDILKEDLESEEPTYEHALGLLAEIKETILDSLLKSDNCAALAQQFRERLDLDLIRQQIENDYKSFDIFHYSNYIIDTLAKVCAPLRDERIAELRKTKDIVVLFKELMKTLDLMKLDMANFLISQTRPLLQQHSVQYERQQFDKFLQTQPGERLQYTREWLYRAKQRLLSDPALSNNATPTPPTPINIQSPSPSPAPPPSTQGHTSSFAPTAPPTGREILHEAFMELLTWSYPIEKYPETCILDVGRFQELSFEYRTVVMKASLLLVTLNSLGVNDTRQTLVEAIKRNISDVIKLSPGLGKPEEVLEGIVAQTVKYVHLDQKLIEGEDKAKSLHSVLLQLKDTNHPVKKLLERRMQRYLKSCLDSATHSNPVAVPAALVPVQKELADLTAQFLKLSSYNREVFRPHYTNIIDDFTMTID